MEEHGTECTHWHPFHPSFPVYMREICRGNGKGSDPLVSPPPPPPARGKWAVWKPQQANCYEIDEDEGVWSRESLQQYRFLMSWSPMNASSLFMLMQPAFRISCPVHATLFNIYLIFYKNRMRRRTPWTKWHSSCEFICSLFLSECRGKSGILYSQINI